MNQRIQTFANTLVGLPGALGAFYVEGWRNAARGASTIITRAKRPTHKVARTGLKVNNIAHHSVQNLVKQQVTMLDGIMDDSAKRLELVADAPGLRELVSEQVALMPKTRKRLSGDARKTIEILAGTRNDLTGLVKDTVNGPAKPARRKASAAVKGARKTVAKKKTRAKKATARRTTTRKTTRKTPARRSARTAKSA